jgi:hypothetical protein
MAGGCTIWGAVVQSKFVVHYPERTPFKATQVAYARPALPIELCHDDT